MEISGHWTNYRENMYVAEIDDREFAIKPMNCPGGILVYKRDIHSYKDFPLRLAELGLVHRHEASGALTGLFRVRNFTQDDAHIYLRFDQIVDEVARLIDLFDYVYGIFNLSYHIELSTVRKKNTSARLKFGTKPKKLWRTPAPKRVMSSKSIWATERSTVRNSTLNSAIPWAGFGNAERFSLT